MKKELPEGQKRVSAVDEKMTIIEPQDVADDRAINELVSSTLLRLKFKDRNDIREETHGAQSLARDETPELVRESLFQMNEELEVLLSSPDNHGSRFGDAYKQARSLPTTFVNDRDYRLKFLRCTLFDPAKAADKMLVHLDYLLLLFGPRALEESVKANFFVKEEAVGLREGNIQLLPFPDQSGRRVLVMLPGCLFYTPMLRVRICLQISLLPEMKRERNECYIISILVGRYIFWSELYWSGPYHFSSLHCLGFLFSSLMLFLSVPSDDR